ncbi:hypothetical protein [Methylobacterium sp. SD21]|uniref:hypothetical protein n=1 Tax=Methylobacterium litchii TaxID=3138810 RepID=UPI00313EB4AD
MTRRTDFWWVSHVYRDGSVQEPEVAEVSWEGDRLKSVLLTGMECSYGPDQIRLIERIAPPRAKAAALPATGSFHG